MPGLPLAIHVIIQDHWGQTRGIPHIPFQQQLGVFWETRTGREWQRSPEALGSKEKKNRQGELRVIRAWSWQEEAARQLINI